MTLKRFLFIPLLVSLALFVHYSDQVADSFHEVTQQLSWSISLIGVIIIAISLQIAGHIVRAYKAKYLFEPIKANTTRFQFRALSIGYLFNTLLPLRLGELIRARIIAGALDVSFGFSLSLIIVERALDAAILGLIGLLLLVLLSITKATLIYYAISLLIIAAIVALVVIVVTTQNRWLFKLFYHLSAIFRATIKNSLRFKAWSIVYGLQRTVSVKRLPRYIALSLLSWLLYASSVLIVVQYLFPHMGIGKKLLATIAPYYGLSIPSGPANLGVFSRVTNSFTQSLHLGSADLLLFNISAWALMVIPIAVVGVVLLFVKTKETIWRHAPRQASAVSLENKLYRSEDISQEMASFLENYFSGNTLSHIVHRLELQQDFRLLRYFKGGSDAITILARQNDQEIVKKIIPPEFEDRLKAQYDWLAQRKGLEGMVNVLGEDRTEHYYAIDLEYRSDDVMFFEFMHKNPIKRSYKIIDEVWDDLFKHVHRKPGKLTLHNKERAAYIKKHIFGCLEKAAKVDGDLLRAAQPATIIINGNEYDNLYQIIDKIKKHPQAWKDIATYRETGVVHGDVAVDNILVSGTGRSLLIDPAPDGNIINGPVFDFGKNMQSLYCGYEFLLRDESPVHLVDGNSISYAEHMSNQFSELCRYVREDLAPKHLSEAEQRSILFHAASLHIRRLKHQVYYNPADVLKFYAVGVKTFNDFLAQYD